MADAFEPLHGGCQCGHIRYVVTAPPRWVGYCHCGQCRKQTGAPTVVWLTALEGTYRFPMEKLARWRSSARAERGGCPRCGTPLVWIASETTPGRSPALDVLVGTLDHPEKAPPTGHIWTDDQVPWLHIKDGLKRRPRGFDSEPSPTTE